MPRKPPPRARRMHDGLVGDRALVGTRYLADPELRRQYEQEIAPRTEVALARIFDQVITPDRRVRRVLDFGAGTGAASAAVRKRFGPHVEIVGVDKVAGPGVIVADVLREVRPARVTGRFDLIVAAHLLNELPALVERRAALLLAWCEELLADGGLCVVLEPALRETSRALLAVRDRVIAEGLFVVAPCLWTGPCPALSRERDFCHASGDALVAGRSRVDFSYLVLARAGTPVTDPALFRVVSDRMEEKGRTRLFGCGPAGRHALVRLSRDESEHNAAFDDVERGEVIRVEGAQIHGDDVRVGADAVVTRVAPIRRA